MSTDRDTKRASWELPAAVWPQMEPLLPPKAGNTGHPRTVDLRRITEGIFSVLRTGGRWPAWPHRPLWPAQHRVRRLPTVGHSRGVWAVGGRGADRR